MTKHTQLEKKQRAIKRLAEIFRDHWEEGRVGSTRIFEHVIPDEWLICGVSSSGGSYREHVVPCVLIRDQSIKMYQEGKMIEDVARMIEKHLAIVLISEEEKNLLDKQRGWKTTMPEDWAFGAGDPFARLTSSGIEFS
ncbi:hypothetical protein AB7M29_005131 [Pseudomonas sp. F-14 TE3623]